MDPLMIALTKGQGLPWEEAVVVIAVAGLSRPAPAECQ